MKELLRTDWRQQWFTPVLLLPFGLMLDLQRWLNLSDAMLAAPAPNEVHWPLFDLAMFAAFALGVAAYVIHTMWSAQASWLLAIIKLVVLGAAWTAVVLVDY